MAFDQRNLAQSIWGILLIAMGVLLFVKKPYALRLSPESAFLTFARYFIAVFLIGGGAKKLYGLYFCKRKAPPSEE
ncbi:MAG: hypothetical protein DRH17_10015 [Deltaproteobacteria bacterium]|nr:MAG: hypothetical protein DRH17_10015 [Deltaproteobacteria bacterium]